MGPNLNRVVTAVLKSFNFSVAYANMLVVSIILLHAPGACQAQSEFLYTANSDDRELIPFASIHIDGVHYFSDSQGRFPVQDMTGDSVFVTRLGFNSLELSVAEIGDTIFLVPNVIQLPAFSVSAVNEPFELGFHDLKPERISLRIFPGLYIGVKLDSEQHPLVVEEVIINFRKIKRGVVFDIYIFDAVSKAEAGEMLYSKRYKTQNSKKFQRIPITDADFVLGSNGGFICIVIPEIETAETSDDVMTPYFRVTEEHDALKSFTFYENQWQIRDRCLEEEEPCPPQNLMIGAKVRRPD